MKNILLILIVALGVGCGESHRSMNNRFSDSVIKYWSLEKCSWECNKKDSMDYYSKRGNLYNDSLRYVWNIDFPNEKQKSRNIPQTKCPCDEDWSKWSSVSGTLPIAKDTEGLTSSTSNDSLVYQIGDTSEPGGAIDAVMQDYRKYGLPKHKPIIIPCCDLETPSKPVSKRMWATPKDCIRVGNLPDTVKPKMGIRGKSKSYYLPRSTMAERLWNKSAQVKNDTLIRIGDNGIEYFDGKKWITIPPVQMPNVTMHDTSDYYLSGDDTIWLNGYREIKIPPSAESLFKGIDTTKKGFSLYMDGGYSSGDTAKIYYNKKKTMQKFKINYGIPGVFTFMPLYDYREAVDEAGARESFKKEYPTWNIYYVKKCTTKKELEAFHWFMVDKNMSPEEKNKILNDWAKQMDSAGYKPIFNYSQDTIGIGADGIHGNPKSLEHMNKEFEKINHKKRHN